MTHVKEPDTLSGDLEKAIRDLLREELEPADKIKAVAEGTKLLMVQHKIDGREAEEGSFFGGKKGRQT